MFDLKKNGTGSLSLGTLSFPCGACKCVTYGAPDDHFGHRDTTSATRTYARAGSQPEPFGNGSGNSCK